MMTNQDLDRIAVDLPIMKAWIAAVEAEILEALQSGAEFQHARLEPIRPVRKWQEGLDMVPLLLRFSDLDTVAPRKALTPAQAEKALGRNSYRENIAGFVTNASSGMKLVFTTENQKD